MKSFFRRLLNAGINPQLTYQETRTVSFLNGLTLLVLLLIVLNISYTLVKTSQTPLEKIKTIGDAYMVVAGLPEKRKDHAEAAAAIGIAMLHVLAKLNRDQEYNLNVRIGICSGPVVAGVIGKRKFSYDLWGDSVNTASRMESHGIPGEIQVTESTFLLLENKYNFDCRGMVEVKGKGLMKTYLLKDNKEKAF